MSGAQRRWTGPFASDSPHGPLASRALFALYRNHPSTAPGDRWGPKAHRRARAQRDALLAWAATLPDERLLEMRHLGVAALAWIRANQPAMGRQADNGTPSTHVHQGEWCGRCLEHGAAMQASMDTVAYDRLRRIEDAARWAASVHADSVVPGSALWEDLQELKKAVA